MSLKWSSRNWSAAKAYTRCDRLRSLRMSKRKRSTASAPSVSPRRYSDLSFQTLFVLGSRVASNDALRLVVSVLPRFIETPAPALPVHRGGGGAGGPEGGTAGVWA